MIIQNYQIHNVLNVYRKQLSQRSAGPSKPINGSQSGGTQEAISGNGKNRSIMDKVAADVVKKITNLNSNTHETAKEVRPGNRENSEQDPYGEGDKFTFNTIDDNNRKETRYISFKDTKGLMVRLNHLARSALDYKSGGKENAT